MNFVTLGRTELQVSRVCLGCMSYGQARTPGVLQWQWTLSEEDSRPHIQRALELATQDPERRFLASRRKGQVEGQVHRALGLGRGPDQVDGLRVDAAGRKGGETTKKLSFSHDGFL